MWWSRSVSRIILSGNKFDRMGESKHPSLQVLVYDDLTLEDLFYCAPTSSHSALVSSYLTHNDRQKVDSLGVYADKTEGQCSNKRKTDS